MTTETVDGSPEPAPPAPPASGSRLVPVLLDVVVVGVWFVVAGLVGGWIWAQVTPLPQVTKDGDNATVPSEELLKQVGMDGWFLVIALIGGVLSGVLLVWWRRRDPLLTVALVTVGAGLASWVMVQAGRLFGPGDEVAALRRLPDGAQVSEHLRLNATGVAWAWPVAAAFGALVFLWVLAKPAEPAAEPDTLR